ncbi:MAG TPA: HAMP domain-containing sensor histidine kinase [Spirillospora sp.]|nr:HAMP domain-containing sensor histidine kinase [Spirillospora sp.]
MTRPASVPAALALLKRLRNAAPPATASKLDQVMALVQALSTEAAFFSARIAEDISLLETGAAPSPVQREVPTLLDQPITDETTVFDILVGVNDALRAPLVGIHGRTELLQSGLLGQISAEQEQWLEAIHHNTYRVFHLLDAVQRLIAIQRGEVQIDWSHFIASDLLEEAYSRIQDRAARRDLEVLIQVPVSVPMARGDFYQSLLILTDLLDNAVHYTPEGGQIRLSVEGLGTHVLFSVADTGIGLRPEDMAYVGTPFWRGEYHPLVRQHAGTGLSLFLARRMLAAQNGELIFSGEPDVGSTFSFTLLAPA